MIGPSPESDIVVLLAHHHDKLKHMITGMTDESASRWPDVVASLVAHETAEERVVYTAIRSDTLPGDHLADELIAEESEIVRALADSGGTPSTVPPVIAEIRPRILEHLRDEEVNLFPLLANLEANTRRWELGYRYLQAIRSAPTRPHPHVPTSGPGREVGARLTALVDRVRDSVGRSAEMR